MYINKYLDTMAITKIIRTMDLMGYIPLKKNLMILKKKMNHNLKRTLLSSICIILTSRMNFLGVLTLHRYPIIFMLTFNQYFKQIYAA